MFDMNRILGLSRRFTLGDLPRSAFYRGLTLALTDEVGCSRASLWLFLDPQRCDSVECLQGYDRLSGQWHAGTVLQAADHGPYFEAMRRDHLIIASDARQHPATACFNDGYFNEFDIRSLLDVGIESPGGPFGLFCCEHSGATLDWSQAQVDYLRQVGTLLGHALRLAREDKAATA
jgi:GAF domain-containing protein